MTSRLPQFASFLQVLATLALVMCPVLTIAAAVAPDLFWAPGSTMGDLLSGTWPLTTWAGLALMAVPLIFVMLALGGMRRLFGLYRAGRPLAPQAGPLIRGIGLHLLIAACLGIVLEPAQTGLMSLANPPGERFISVSLNSSDVGFVLIAGLLVMIGWSMAEAQRIAQENEAFV